MQRSLALVEVYFCPPYGIVMLTMYGLTNISGTSLSTRALAQLFNVLPSYHNEHVFFYYAL